MGEGLERPRMAHELQLPNQHTLPWQPGQCKHDYIHCAGDLGQGDSEGSLLKKLFIYFQRVERKEKEGGKHQRVVASLATPTGHLACNPGMCPAWELNWRSCGLQARAQSTEPHQPGLGAVFKSTVHGFFKKAQCMETLHTLQFAPLAGLVGHLGLRFPGQGQTVWSGHIPGTHPQHSRACLEYSRC